MVGKAIDEHVEWIRAALSKKEERGDTTASFSADPPLLTNNPDNNNTKTQEETKRPAAALETMDVLTMQENILSTLRSRVRQSLLNLSPFSTLERLIQRHLPSYQNSHIVRSAGVYSQEDGRKQREIQRECMRRLLETVKRGREEEEKRDSSTSGNEVMDVVQDETETTTTSEEKKTSTTTSEEKKTSTTTTTSEEKKTSTTTTTTTTAPPPPTTFLPEIYVYFANLTVWCHLSAKSFREASDFSFFVVSAVSRGYDRRSLDLFLSKTFSLASLAFERKEESCAHAAGITGTHLRNLLLRCYRTTCLQHNDYGKAVLLNLLVRGFLRERAYDRAHALVEKTLPFPEQASNNQFVRHLYYRGSISAVRDSKYPEAFKLLSQALRKMPSHPICADFRVRVQKLAVVVQLLCGDLPERSLFNQPELRNKMDAYLALAQAIRAGDSRAFEAVLTREENAAAFRKDDTQSLVLRLKSNVLKAGLKRITTAYSRISFQDIAQKLSLGTAREAECVCAKAIRDGVIRAELDHAKGCMQSKELADAYSTAAPRKAFHLRTSFCLDIHNEAVKAMRYPPDAFLNKDDGDDDQDGDEEEDDETKEEKEREEAKEIAKEEEEEEE